MAGMAKHDTESKRRDELVLWLHNGGVADLLPRFRNGGIDALATPAEDAILGAVRGYVKQQAEEIAKASRQAITKDVEKRLQSRLDEAHTKIELLVVEVETTADLLDKEQAGCRSRQLLIDKRNNLVAGLQKAVDSAKRDLEHWNGGAGLEPTSDTLKSMCTRMGDHLATIARLLGQM
jgi:hypothetical protein